MSSNTPLADLHEFLEFIFLKYDANLSIENFPDPNMVTLGDGLIPHEKELSRLLNRIEEKDHLKARVKIIQAYKSSLDLKQYLQLDNEKRDPPIPEHWKLENPDLFWEGSLKITDCGWTNTPDRFTSFVSEFQTSCAAGGTESRHDNNPSDVVLVVLNKITGESRLLGISLKATEGESDITISNLGLPAFIALVSERGDLGDKKALCSSEECTNKVAETRLAYDDHLQSLALKGSTIEQKKVCWKQTYKGTKREKDKLVALSVVRDSLFNKMVVDLGGDVSVDLQTFSVEMTEEDVFKILGGIFQFSHAAIKRGGRCDVPYLKSTSYIPKENKPLKVAGNLGSANCGTRIEAPLLSKYVNEGQSLNTVTIEKCADVSVKLTFPGGGFLIRVKLESVPPSSIKIDISPLIKKPPKKSAPKKSAQVKKLPPKKSIQKSKKKQLTAAASSLATIADTSLATTADTSLATTADTSLITNATKTNKRTNKTTQKGQSKRKKILNDDSLSGGGNNNFIITGDNMFDDIQQSLGDMTDYELALLYRIYWDNCTMVSSKDENEEDEEDEEDEKETESCNDGKSINKIKGEIIKSIDLELKLSEVNDPDLYSRFKLDEPIITRALGVLQKNIGPLTTLKEKLISLKGGSKRKSKIKSHKRKSKRKSKSKRKK